MHPNSPDWIPLDTRSHLTGLESCKSLLSTLSWGQGLGCRCGRWWWVYWNGRNSLAHKPICSDVVSIQRLRQNTSKANSTSGTCCIMLPGSHTLLQLWSELASLRWDVCFCHLKVIIESLLEDHRLIQQSVLQEDLYFRTVYTLYTSNVWKVWSRKTLGWGQVNCDLPKGRAAWLRSSFDWLTGLQKSLSWWICSILPCRFLWIQIIWASFM